jgi:hypothetical protein
MSAFTLRPMTDVEFATFRLNHDALNVEQGWPATDWQSLEPLIQIFDDGKRLVFWRKR